MKKSFITGLEKFLSNQNLLSIEKQLETLLFVLYYLNRTCSFHF